MPNSASSFVEVNTGSNTLNNNSVENDVMPSGLWESHANVDRQWLSKLLQKNHAGRSSKEKQQSSALNETYPILRGKALAVAPMVEQSDLPFRLLCREYGANLCYTPMINARYFVQNSSYRRKMFNFDNGSAGGRDRPLIAQLCANNKEILLQGAKLLECHVDAVDLNCGCPTKVAKRGRFGAYLLESGEYLVSIVKHLAENLSIPVTVKVRLLPHQDINKSLDLYRKLVDAGAALLTVHGRTRYNKGENTSRADWDAIRKVVKSVGDRVPVIANGSISSLDDACACLTATGADGVMSSEAILEYPALYLEAHTAAVKFRRTGPGRLQIAREYLARCREFPPEEGGGGTKLQCIKRHLQVFCHEEWKDQPTLHDALFPVRRHAFEELVESHGTEW
eukprot:CAMPEP_0183718586 /NCGR_PEP_ID=MMETSP0737-20130205/11812_1 /TAXON_ID=385413 /ORGANISM="Thalassiosira miniscula, Strain CCMP1093" /LENGTH=394 /DNA_ID=CAMNT_0025948175 /DNA_START=37 /DNA_END=1218 /DNA_ORIENTATION=+